MVLFWYQSKFNNVSDFMKEIGKKYPIAFNLMLQVIFYKNKKILSIYTFNRLFASSTIVKKNKIRTS